MFRLLRRPGGSGAGLSRRACAASRRAPSGVGVPARRSRPRGRSPRRGAGRPRGRPCLATSESCRSIRGNRRWAWEGARAIRGRLPQVLAEELSKKPFPLQDLPASARHGLGLDSIGEPCLALVISEEALLARDRRRHSQVDRHEADDIVVTGRGRERVDHTVQADGCGEDRELTSGRISGFSKMFPITSTPSSVQ